MSEFRARGSLDIDAVTHPGQLTIAIGCPVNRTEDVATLRLQVISIAHPSVDDLHAIEIVGTALFTLRSAGHVLSQR